METFPASDAIAISAPTPNASNARIALKRGSRGPAGPALPASGGGKTKGPTPPSPEGAERRSG